MVEEIARNLKSQEEVNDLMANLWLNRKEPFKSNYASTYFVNALPDITEEEREEWDYKRRLRIAVRIVENGYPISWANGITRIPTSTILNEYAKILIEKRVIIQKEKKIIQKMKRKILIKFSLFRIFNTLSFKRIRND